MNMQLSLNEAAALVSLSPTSIRHLATGGIIPSRSEGGVRTIPRDELVRWAQSWGEKLRAAELTGLIA
jgi:hypothetical protein